MKSLLKLLSFLTELIFPLGDTAKLVREVTPELFGRVTLPALTSCGYTGLLPYRHRIVRAVIIEAKYHKNKRAISLLAQTLTEYLSALAEDTYPFDTKDFVIIPIPLGPKRLHERGYNQVEEVIKTANIHYEPNLLVRTRETAPQTTLPKGERTQNVRNAFRAVGPFTTSVTYVVLDDVTTTGATLHEAVTVLEEQGIHPIALALAY